MPDKLLDILREISEIIAANDNYRVVLDRIVDTLAEKLDVEVCSVYVHEEQAHELVLLATHGLNRDSVGKVKMKPGEGLTGVSFLERSILNISKPEKHPKFKYFQSTGEERYKSFLSVPLTVGGKCVGILTIQRIAPKRFNTPVVDMVKSLSTQLANLILNARMLQKLAKDESDSEYDAQGGNSEQTVIRGIAANDGIARGSAFIFESANFFQSIPHSENFDPEKELLILEKAVEITKQKTISLEKRALSMISEADASIFYAHLLFLEDKALLDGIKKEITENMYSAEFSIKTVFGEYQKRFRKLKDQSFRDKVIDLKDVMLRLVESITLLKKGRVKSDSTLPDSSGVILISEELMPSDLIRLPVDNINGIVCQKGGATAHVAILAKALNIPALMGVNSLAQQIRNGDELILDCHAELMYIRPNEKIKRHFEEMINTGVRIEETPDPDPAKTKDGVKITLRANISLICETSMLKKYGAEGIGLYRTEFLFMIRDYLPSEEDQYKVYSKIIKEADGNEVTIRVLDTGGDKPLPYLHFPKEDNPALGNRGIRLLLSNQELFKTQLRAILRAGAPGKVKILFPMVSSTGEIILIKEILSEVETELHEKKIDHIEDYKIGIMLEVPSAVFALETLIQDIDYMSIGSNDLLQYTFASDRGNELTSSYCEAFHPVFLNILDRIGLCFSKNKKKEIAICGEMAGNILTIPFIIGAGIRDLSMPPRQIPAAKKVIRAFSEAECIQLLEKAKKLSNPETVNALARNALFDKGLIDNVTGQELKDL